MEATVKEERKKLIAMVPSCWAKKGSRFLFLDTFNMCGSCELRSGCVSSLAKGSAYEIVRLRKKTFTCPHEGVEYQVVEAKPSRLEVAVPRERCFEGAVHRIVLHRCRRRFCENHSFCAPEGAGEGERWKVVRILGTLECPDGRSLIKASLEKVP